VFDRHNFARDVRRNVKAEDWIFLKPRYLLTEQGIVQFAFRKNVVRLVDKFMAVLDRPLMPGEPMVPLTLPQPLTPQQSLPQPSNSNVAVKYDPIPASPPQPHEDALIPMTPAHDFAAPWEAYDGSSAPFRAGAQNTPSAVMPSPNPLLPSPSNPLSASGMHNSAPNSANPGTTPNGSFAQNSMGTRRDSFAASFFNLDEPYYPTGSDAASLKRKTPYDDMNDMQRAQQGVKRPRPDQSPLGFDPLMQQLPQQQRLLQQQQQQLMPHPQQFQNHQQFQHQNPHQHIPSPNSGQPQYGFVGTLTGPSSSPYTHSPASYAAY